MLMLTPPQVIAMPKEFNEKLHDKKDWIDQYNPCDLVYFRPVLFYDRYGAVAAAGQVGNIPRKIKEPIHDTSCTSDITISTI